MPEHGFKWDDVRNTLATDLKVGDVWVNPGIGTACYTYSDGSVKGAGWQDLDGTAWTVTERNGDTIKARSHDGRTSTGDIPKGRHVLMVKRNG